MTAALRAALVVAAFVLGIFVLSRAFPTGGEGAPVTPSETGAPGGATSPAPEVTTESPAAPATHEPGEIMVQILNGTDVQGLAEDTAGVLEDDGYDVQTIGDAQNKPYEISEIFFKRRFEADAQALAETYFPGAELKDTAPDADVSITVILGVDYAEQQASA